MKKHIYLTSALIGLIGMALLAPSANAQSTITPSNGDLILGFQVEQLFAATTGTYEAAQGPGTSLDLEIDLGQVSKYYNPSTGLALSGTSFTLPALAVADLVATYGANWDTRSDLFWGIVATTGKTSSSSDGLFGPATIWQTNAESTPGTLSTPLICRSKNSQQAPTGNIQGLYLGTGPLNGATSTANSPTAAIINASTLGSWTSQETTGPQAGVGVGFSFGSQDNTTDIPVGGYSVSDLYELPPGSGSGILLGAFGLSNSGTLTFSTQPSQFAVPEPSGITLLGVAGGVLAATRLRRSRQSFSAQ